MGEIPIIPGISRKTTTCGHSSVKGDFAHRSCRHGLSPINIYDKHRSICVALNLSPMIDLEPWKNPPKSCHETRESAADRTTSSVWPTTGQFSNEKLQKKWMIDSLQAKSGQLRSFLLKWSFGLLGAQILFSFLSSSCTPSRVLDWRIRI